SLRCTARRIGSHGPLGRAGWSRRKELELWVRAGRHHNGGRPPRWASGSNRTDTHRGGAGGPTPRGETGPSSLHSPPHTVQAAPHTGRAALPHASAAISSTTGNSRCPPPAARSPPASAASTTSSQDRGAAPPA